MFTNLYVMILSTIVPIAVLMAALMLSQRSSMDRDKLSPFECGFDPMKSARIPFSMRFFLLTIIFLVFDIEIVLLMPLVSFSNLASTYPMILSISFVIILIVGLFHEWNQGSLEWT
uniref:NADH-ubiquinone oxidoreductase chain 3 n=1 Tax=Dinophilus gyrociliatus TaxID=120995 RepID=A0A343TAR0_9ANNE|nr:NADH dehydrogenase subunit 3 [Dinophilus gyrociliatus]